MRERTATPLAGILLLFALATPGASAQDTVLLYEEACDGGDFIACNVFGLMLETGEGVPTDLARAARLYQRACEGGELIGCTNIGLLHMTGLGVPVDTALATGLFQVACEGGEDLGCNLFRAFEDADVVDPAERFDKTGRVGDAVSGQPLAGALLELVGRGVQAITDRNGSAEFVGLAAGTYRVKAQRLGYQDSEGIIQVPGGPRFLVLMTRDDVADPGEPGRIVGRVSEGPNNWLSNVEVAVLDQPFAHTLTNRDGRFTMREVEPGLLDVRFSRLGYAPRSVKIVVQPGRTVEVAATMFVEPIELDPIQVTARSSFLERTGFYRRAESGSGTHITAQQIEQLVPQRLSHVLQNRVPGLRIQYGAYGPPPTDTVPFSGPASSAVARPMSRRSNCALTVYVDGRQEMMEVDLDHWLPEELEAIEVYTGIDTPAEFATNYCGVILLWTRRGN